VTRTRIRLAALTLLAAVTLSGCGDLHPGIAARVGDESITESEVDSIARDVCTAFQSDDRLLQEGGYARSQVLQSVVQSFVMRAMATQLSEQYDVTPTSSYADAVSKTKLTFATLDDDVRTHILDTWTGYAYFVDVVREVGKKKLRAEGVAAPTSNDALSKGIELAQVWEEEHGVEIDPRFPSLSLSNQDFTRTHDQTAYPVSEIAKQSVADQPTAEFISSLPPSQRCD